MLLFVALLFSFKIAMQSLLARKRAGAGDVELGRSSEPLAEWPEHKTKMPKAQTRCQTACYNWCWVGATAGPLL